MKRIVLLALLFFGLAFAQELEIHFIDVGQGDSVFVRSPTGQTLLYDGGPRTDAAYEYLESIGVTSLNLVVASHADADHIRGLVRAITELRPPFFMDNGLVATTNVYENLLLAVQGAGSTLIEPAGQEIGFGSATIRVLAPPPDSIPGLNSNNHSVGLVITYGTFKVAMFGDAEKQEFDWWLSQGLLEDVVLHKASHHGSNNGDTALGLLTLRPEVIVIGVGANNNYGHPTPEALSRYAATGARVLRTDLNGTVVVRSDGAGGVTILTDRSPQVEPAAVAVGGVEIRCVLYNPAGQDAQNEVVTLRASRPVTLVNWYLEDAANNRLEVPDGALVADEELAVRIPGSAMWNNGGDTAFLFNQLGGLVDSFSYAGGGSVACR